MLETGNRTLVEASFDDIWGTGIHITSRDALEKNKWRSVRLLGKILMGIRDSQIESHTNPSTENTDTNMAESQPDTIP